MYTDLPTVSHNAMQSNGKSLPKPDWTLIDKVKKKERNMEKIKINLTLAAELCKMHSG